MHTTMKKAGLIPAFFICMNASVFGQVYFDTLFDSYGFTETLKNVVNIEEGYLFAARSRNQSADTAIITLIAIDEFGDEFRRTEFNAGLSTHTFGQLTAHPDSGYIFFNSIGSQAMGSGLDFSAIHFDADGEVVWANRFGEIDRNDICYHGIVCSNNGFAIVGQSNNPSGTSSDIMLIRTSIEGVEQWRQYYGGTDYEGAGYSGLVQTPDSGFLISGWTMSFGNGQRDFYLVKTDSLGEQEWQQTYGDEGDEGGSCIIALNDGNYMLTGGGWNATATGSVGRLYKIDPLGQVIWSKIYEYDRANYLFKTIELEDGSLVSTGLTNTTNDAGWLIKTDSEGNELWQRKYNKNENTDLFYSVLLAEDGGFLLSGQARNAETGSQDAWLLKVDSVGCPYPNCLVGVDEVEPSKVMVDVWPNPVEDMLNIELQQQGMAEVQLYDIAGKLVLQKQTTQLREIIDVSALGNGLYLLTVLQGKMKTTVKVMVQR